MDQQLLIGPNIETLFVSVILLQFGIAGLAHIVGGAAWSGRVVKFFASIWRWILSLPFVLLGQMVTFAGHKIRGSAPKKRKRK